MKRPDYAINTGIMACVMFAVVMNLNGANNYAVSVLTLIMNLLSIFRVRKNWYMFIIYSFITYCNYSVLATMYMSPPPSSLFSTYILTETGTLGLNILCVFSLGLLLVSSGLSAAIRNTHARRIINITEGSKNNPLLVYGLVAVLVMILIYGFGRPAALGIRGSPSQIYEYSIVLVIIGFYYSGNNKILLYVLTFIGVCFALQNFIFGGRVTGCQYILVITLSLHTEKLKSKLLILAAVIVMILMFAIGGFRATLLINKDIAAAILSTVINAFKNGFVLDTAYSAYHTSMTFLRALDFHGWSMRLYLFSRWAVYVFMGSGVSDANLANYTAQFFAHCGGGILPYFAYFYLGIPGLVIILLYMRCLFTIIIRDTGSIKKPYIRMISIYVTSTVPRWYLYSPSQITRALFLFFVAYCATYLFDRLSLRRNHLQ